jgi:hypothetical protein
VSRRKLAVNKRCIVDACIQGAYEQWRQFGRKLKLAAQLEAIAPSSGPRLNFADPEESNRLGRLILDENPELSVEVNVQDRDGPNQVISPDVGVVSPIELYESSVSEHRVRVADGSPAPPIGRHPDGHRSDPDDGHDPMFGRRFLDQRPIIARPSKPWNGSIPTHTSSDSSCALRSVSRH